MGQSTSVPVRSSKVNDEKDTDIWSTVLHISDRDVLVQNIGRNKKEKVKLNHERKPSKMDNVHLADRKRLEGIPSFKRRSARRNNRYPTGIVNQGSSSISIESMDEKTWRKSGLTGADQFASDEAEESLVENT